MFWETSQDSLWSSRFISNVSSLWTTLGHLSSFHNHLVKREIGNRFLCQFSSCWRGECPEITTSEPEVNMINTQIQKMSDNIWMFLLPYLFSTFALSLLPDYNTYFWFFILTENFVSWSTKKISSDSIIYVLEISLLESFFKICSNSKIARKKSLYWFCFTHLKLNIFIITVLNNLVICLSVNLSYHSLSLWQSSLKVVHSWYNCT